VALIDRALAGALWAILAVGALLFAAVGWKMLVYPHEVVISEGAVGLGVRSIVDGAPLYAQSRFTQEPFVVLHYTPLYYLLTAPLMSMTKEPFAAGRFVSIFFTIGTALVVAAIVRRATRSSAAALAGALVWLSFYQVVFWGTTQRVDAPAIFFEVLGIALALRARERDRIPWEALPLFVLAWSTKQVMVVGLVAVVADLLIRNRRQGLRFLGAGVLALGAALLLLSMGTDGAFWRATVQGTVSADADPPWVIFSNAELFFGSPWNMLLFAFAGGGAWWRRDRLLGIYLGFGLAFAIATDANFPRFFPPMAAMAILVAGFLHDLAVRPAMRTAALATLVFFGGAHLLYEMRSLIRERIVSLSPHGPRLTVASALASITKPDGTVLAQDVGMVLSAHRNPGVADPLVLSILAGNNAWDPTVLAEGIRERRYDAIVLNSPIESIDDHEWTTLWIAPVRAEIARTYRLADRLSFDASWRFLEPDRYVYLPAGTVGAK
jgi:4-amino-4-deoxy-L-arabinose transferase-like glycosyltransferase